MKKLLTIAVVCAAALAIAGSALAGGEVPAKKYTPAPAKRYIPAPSKGGRALAPLPAPACQTKEMAWGNAIINYPANRYLDFVRIWRGNVGYGKGFIVDAHATEYLQAGYGEAEQTGWAMSKARSLSYKNCPYNESGAQLGPWKTGTFVERDPTEIGFDVQAGVGVGAGASMSQAWDFLAGIVFLDPAGDDLK
jgi:hypothetical protein